MITNEANVYKTIRYLTKQFTLQIHIDAVEIIFLN